MPNYFFILFLSFGISASDKNGRFMMPLEGSSESVPVAPFSDSERIFGSYSNGCILGAKPFETSTDTWELVNTQRNHQHAHSSTIHFVDNLGKKSVKNKWGKLLVGDSSCPMGGKMSVGHSSHRIGLDVDIFFKFRATDSKMSNEERNSWNQEIQKQHEIAVYELQGQGIGAKQKAEIKSETFKAEYMELLKLAAQESEVDRLFVSPPIKKKLCDLYLSEKKPSSDIAWLKKIRPIDGHKAHFHVRLKCPGTSPDCKAQSPIRNDPTDSTGVGCAGDEFSGWFKPKNPGDPQPAKTPSPPPEKCVEEMYKLNQIKISETVRCLVDPVEESTSIKTIRCRDFEKAISFTEHSFCSLDDLKKQTFKCFQKSEKIKKSKTGQK